MKLGFFILLLAMIMFWVFPMVKIYLDHFKYKKIQKEYIRRSNIIVQFLKNDNSGDKKYHKEMLQYLKLLYDNLTSVKKEDCYDESEKIFNLFKDIIPEFKQENRNKKLNQLLK